MATIGFLEKSSIPGIKKTILPNGITVFLEYLPEENEVVFLLGVGVGSRNDESELSGESHFTEHTLFHSNRFRTAAQIVEDVEDSGDDIDAGTDFDSTYFLVLGNPKYLSRNIRIVYEAIANFRYNEEEIERDKMETISELKKYIDSPEKNYINHLFIPILLRRTFAERPMLGSSKTVKRFNIANLVAFKKKFYVPSNMVIFVCGKFNEEKAMKAIEKTFGAMKKRDFERKEWNVSLKIRRKEKITKRKGLKQAYMALGYRTPGFKHRDCSKLILIDSILSDGMSSRLYRRLRGERGIGHDLDSVYDDYGGIGAFYVKIDGLDPSQFEEAKEVILNEFEDLRNNLVTKREFRRAKNRFLLKYNKDLKDLEERAVLFVDAYFRGDVFDFRKLRKEIDKISREALRRVAQKYFGDGYTLTALVPENFEI